MIGGRRFHHGATDSTNERAFAALASGEARHGDVHVADAQSAGRGRLGRRWESPAGGGLYLSVALLPRRPLVAVPLTMAAGLGVLDAVQELRLRAARLDWPNDVMVRGAKLAGVLVEARGGPGCVLGVGVNVSQLEFPAELRAEREVTSLALEGLRADRGDLEAQLVSSLGTWLERVEDQDPGVATAYLEGTGLLGRRVEVAVGAERHGGTVTGIEFGRGLGLEAHGEVRWCELAHVRSVTVSD